MPQIIIEHSKGLEEEILLYSKDEESKNNKLLVLQKVCDEIWEKFASHSSVTGPETVSVRCISASASKIF